MIINKSLFFPCSPYGTYGLSVPVPAETWSGQVECWWGLQVVVSWRFGTATEPECVPRSAEESWAVAHSHCEPKPCLQEVHMAHLRKSKTGVFLVTAMTLKICCMSTKSRLHVSLCTDDTNCMHTLDLKLISNGTSYILTIQDVWTGQTWGYCCSAESYESVMGDENAILIALAYNSEL